MSQAEAGVHRGGHPALRPGLEHLLGKPQVAGLVAQGHVGPGDGYHAGGVERLTQGKLDLHGVGRAIAEFAIQHGLLIVVENHVLAPPFD